MTNSIRIGIGCGVLVVAGATHAGTLVVSPVDAQAVTEDGAVWTIDPGSFGLNASRFSIPLERRGIMEFPLADLPAGAQITSVTLEYTVNSYTSPPNPIVEFHGYAGDGVMSVSDATVPFNHIGESPPIDGLTTMSATLDPMFVQSLVGSASHLGVMTWQQMLGLQGSFWSNQGVGTPPALIIEYEEEEDCPADVDGDGMVGVLDLVEVIIQFGICDPTVDINGDGFVDVLDLILVITIWGPCP
jgi:hypothetical protein